MRQVTLRAAGSVALAAAVSQIASGARSVRGFDWRVAAETLPRAALASVDSELRFYAVWYGVAGALMLRAATDEELDQALHPMLAVGWGAAASARLLSVRGAGTPDPLFLALGGAEAALAAILAVARRRANRNPDR